MKNKTIFIPLLGIVLMLSNGCKKDEDQPITDKDDNVYTSVLIGTQTWMVENLKTTKYCDGESIPIIRDSIQWSEQLIGAYCDYNNDPNNSIIHGKLYNWYAVNTGCLCPEGWHVPSDEEWKTLITTVGGFDTAGGILKEAGTAHWISPNTGATNLKGFKGLPGGGRNGVLDLIFGDIGYNGLWRTSTESGLHSSWFYFMDSNSSLVVRTEFVKKQGYSVRCIKN